MYPTNNPFVGLNERPESWWPSLPILILTIAVVFGAGMYVLLREGSPDEPAQNGTRRVAKGSLGVLAIFLFIGAVLVMADVNEWVTLAVLTVAAVAVGIANIRWWRAPSR